jgi:hypothetical protein
MDTLKVKKKDRKIILWVKMLGGIDVFIEWFDESNRKIHLIILLRK